MEITIKLQKEEVMSLAKFLSRVELRGNEVPEFNRVMGGIQQAITQADRAAQQKQSSAAPVDPKLP